MDSTTFLLATAGLIVATLILFLVAVYRMSRRNATPQASSDGFLLLQQRVDSMGKSVNDGLNQVTANLLVQLKHVTEQVNERLKENMEMVQGANKTVGERLDRAAVVVRDVHQKLGQIEEANKRIFEVGLNISSLQEILRAPKLRGGLGELFLGDLLAQILPPAHFTLQHRFKSGDVVDAAIHLRDDRIVPVDSKFPLENFQRMITADDEKLKNDARKLFISDVKKHIDKIAKQYIVPDEGTFDFALMYIPAENVYYETIIRGADEHTLMHYAFEKRVIPVSPNTLYVYLQSILLGLRGLHIEKSAREMLQNLQRLRVDFGKFTDDFELVGTHLSRARNSYEDTTKRLARLQDKLALGEPAANEHIPLPPVAS